MFELLFIDVQFKKKASNICISLASTHIYFWSHHNAEFI